MHCSQPPCKFQHVTTRYAGGGGLACVGVRRTLAQFGDAKQAMGEGKSDPVETGLTGSAATALRICDQLNV